MSDTNIDGRKIGGTGYFREGERRSEPEDSDKYPGLNKIDVGSGSVEKIFCKEVDDVAPGGDGWQCQINGRENGGPRASLPAFHELDIDNAETRAISGRRGPDQIHFTFPSGGECRVESDSEYSDPAVERTLVCQ